MIIRIKDYDEKPRIFSFAKSESVKDYLLGKDLSTGLLGNRSIIIYPENITLNLSEEETQRFSSCTDYDIFQVDSRGNAYKYFNNASLDNAILVTNRCNSNCVMCPTAESIRKNGENYYGDELINIAKYFPDDVCHITITGGEPFLIGKSIFDLLYFLRENLPNTSYLLLLLFAQNEKSFRIKYKKCVFVKMYNVAKKYPRRKSKSAWVFSFFIHFSVSILLYNKVFACFFNLIWLIFE